MASSADLFRKHSGTTGGELKTEGRLTACAGINRVMDGLLSYIVR